MADEFVEEVEDVFGEDVFFDVGAAVVDGGLGEAFAEAPGGGGVFDDVGLDGVLAVGGEGDAGGFEDFAEFGLHVAGVVLAEFDEGHGGLLGAGRVGPVWRMRPGSAGMAGAAAGALG